MKLSSGKTVKFNNEKELENNFLKLLQTLTETMARVYIVDYIHL